MTTLVSAVAMSPMKLFSPSAVMVTGWSPVLLTGGVVRTAGAWALTGGAAAGEREEASGGGPFSLDVGRLVPTGGAEPSGVAPGVEAEAGAGGAPPTVGAASGGRFVVAAPSGVAGGTGASCAHANGTPIQPAQTTAQTPRRTVFKRLLLAAETALCQPQKKKSTMRTRAPPPSHQPRGLSLLRLRLQGRGHALLVARSGVAVHDTLLGRAIDKRLELGKELGGLVGLARLGQRTDFLLGGADGRDLDAV